MRFSDGKTQTVFLFRRRNQMHLVRHQAILLYTDGFWEYILENEMEELLSNSASTAQWLQ
jgi:serine/threonine protein phosphatase PrpC